MAAGKSPSIAVITEIAKREGVHPTELTPLHECIDPAALDALFDGEADRSSSDTMRFEFRYCGYTVIVEGTGQVRVNEVTPTGGEDNESRDRASVD